MDASTYCPGGFDFTTSQLGLQGNSLITWLFVA
ncbi:BgTH12-04779 [Blumeria graminis f. sp. triticale]|uniref:BgTH12-04779 n=1 Tax=Blumeria graminis f. sp. triticale TaxID=1689686 RepID=A0A9W4CZE3_BLUGR|nr:BgTH12-04779 [Blumeria graminis f. sp. triticale]